MGKVTGSYFENPYLEEVEHNPSVELIMDEARQKWRAGVWKPKRDSFAIEREELAGDEEEPKNAPSSDRFKLDIKKDLMGEGISLESLKELVYTPSYRPKGTLEKLDEATFVPMSTLQRYDVLAGELEAPPEDISFLSDAQSKHRKAVIKTGEKKDGKLRTDTKRLEESVDSRRSEILRLLPSADEDDTRRIIDESKRRKAREDRELGRPAAADNAQGETYRRLAKLAKDSKKKKREYLSGLNIDPWDDYDSLVKTEGERMARLPKQDGMTDEKRELPEFESQTRYWSRIDAIDPTWSEIAAHTETTSPDDEEKIHEPRYVDEKLFDEKDPYKELLPPRKRLRSNEAGHYDTEYIREAGIDPKHIKELMEKKYRGRWVPPEFFSDDNLVNDWFNQYNRGALSGEDYVHWAYRQRVMEQQQKEAERLAREQAEYEREQAERKPAYHANSDGRKYPPFAQAVAYVPTRDIDGDRQRIEEAEREGYIRGAEIDRIERMREDRMRAHERRRDYERERDRGRYGGRDRRDGRDIDRFGRDDGRRGSRPPYDRYPDRRDMGRADGRPPYDRYARPYDPRAYRSSRDIDRRGNQYDSRYNMYRGGYGERGRRERQDAEDLRAQYPRRRKYW